MCLDNLSEKKPFVCVNCGSHIDALFKKYNPTVLKLTECSSCSKIADKYVEYDVVIVLIDLVLFKRDAYRHILYNTEFKNHWKLALIVLFVKVFNQWTIEASNSGVRQPLMVTESAIYALAGHTVSGCLAYISVIFVLLTAVNIPWKFTHLMLQWKALVLSNISQFFLLPSIIWQDLNRETHLIFVIVYTLISQIQALSVVTETPRTTLCGFIVTAFIAEALTLQHTRLLFT